jgi:hypothetical protein
MGRLSKLKRLVNAIAAAEPIREDKKWIIHGVLDQRLDEIWTDLDPRLSYSVPDLLWIQGCLTQERLVQPSPMI